MDFECTAKFCLLVFDLECGTYFPKEDQFCSACAVRLGNEGVADSTERVVLGSSDCGALEQRVKDDTCTHFFAEEAECPKGRLGSSPATLMLFNAITLSFSIDNCIKFFKWLAVHSLLVFLCSKTNQSNL